MKKRLFKIGMGIIVLSFLLVLGACDLVPPDAPKITGSFTNTTTTIRWSEVSGAKEYTVYYGTSSATADPSTFTALATTKKTTYTHVTNYKHSYAVKASNNAGDSDFSNVIYVP